MPDRSQTQQSGSPAAGSVTNATVASNAAIDATKIADGSVTNAEFQRLDATSSIQTQIDSKLSLNAGLLGVTGASGAASPATGKIGEQLTAQGSASCGTGGQTQIVTKTLTEGVWLVSGGVNNDNNGVQTGWDAYLYIKGANTATYALDRVFVRYVAGNAAGSAYHPRIVVVASGDADKTIAIKCQTVTASADIYGSVSAIRIA